MGTLSEDVEAGATWTAATLNKAGYNADFTLASLGEVERSLNEHAADGSPHPSGLFGADTSQRLFAVGAYIGEVLRRTLGGDWEPDANNPDSRIGAQLALPGGTVIWPVRRVVARIANGSEDSITAYGAALIAMQERAPGGNDPDPPTARRAPAAEPLVKGYAMASILIPLAGMLAFTLVACMAGLILGALTRKYAPFESRWRVVGTVGYTITIVVFLLFLVEHSGFLPRHR